MIYEFKNASGITCTLAERFVQVGIAKWSNKVVYDLTTKTGTRTYNEKDLASALATQFNAPLQKGVKAVQMFKSGALGRSRYAS